MVNYIQDASPKPTSLKTWQNIIKFLNSCNGIEQNESTINKFIGTVDYMDIYWKKEKIKPKI